MKKIAVSVILLSLFASQALAIAPINPMVIQDAQEYGRRSATEPYAAFVAPWTAFEEKAQKLNQFTDQAQIFTPYLLIAANARERTLRKQPLLLENSEKALAAYEGYLVFSVTVFSEKVQPALTARLIQDKQTQAAYYLSPPIHTTYTVNDKALTGSQLYVYFSDKTIVRNRPVYLRLSDSAKRNRTFFFDLEKIL